MYRRDVLDNGITVLSEAAPHVGSASLGFWIHSGSRWETEAEAGISHCLEHMVFKGTERRSARDIAEQLDSVGGHLNAFTDKEATCYYARVLGEHLPLAFDVLSDMLLHSVFAPEELELEKNVILEEIKQHEDDPEGLVHDLFARELWPDHPLGRPVIGSPETVAALTRDMLLRYTQDWYAPNRIVVAAAGNLHSDQILELVGIAFGELKPGDQESHLSPPVVAGGTVRQSREIEQMNLCYGFAGLPQTSPRRYALACMDVAFGGGMSSRLFQEIREKRGLAYSIGSYFMGYHDSGQYTIYAGTSPETEEEVLAVLREEAERLCQDGLTAEELRRAQNQIKGSMLMDLESMSSRMSRLGKTELYFGRVVDVDEVVAEIEAVTLDAVTAVARQVLHGEAVLAAIGPPEESEFEESAPNG